MTTKVCAEETERSERPLDRAMASRRFVAKVLVLAQENSAHYPEYALRVGAE